MFYHEPTRAETRKGEHVAFTAGARRAAENEEDERGAHGKGGTANNARHRTCGALLVARGKNEKGEKEEMNKGIRGMGRVYARNRVYWIAFYHRGRQIRESSGSEKEAVARKLLKRRLGET